MTQIQARQALADKNLSNISVGALLEVLEHLGNLSADFDYLPLIELCYHPLESVRQLAVKNLAKVKNNDLTQLFVDIYGSDSSSAVKREAISGIGRQRDIKNIDFLLEVINDGDPKIVCQAIRALLVFKGNKRIDNVLKTCINHDNEMVKQVIKKEYFSSTCLIEKQKPHVDVEKSLTNIVVLGDVLEILEHVKEESVHLTFTSPPYYNARDYAIYPSYEAYLSFLDKVFDQTHRITKEGRFLIVNTSPIIVPRISRAHSSKRYPIPFDLHAILVRQGWEFIDDIIWEKPEYSVKNRVGGFEQHRKPLGYKPNSVTEYLMVYRKKTDKLLDWNIHQYSDDIVKKSKVSDGYETTNIWKIHPKSDKVHSAVFPVELCKKVIEYYSFNGDLVFDPFAGSGTLGRTAKRLNRKFFLAEKEEVYFEYMKSMIEQNDLLSTEQETRFMTLNEFILEQNKSDI